MNKHQLDPRHVVIQRVTVPHYVYEEMKKDTLVGYPEDITDLIKDIETELFGVDWTGDCGHWNHVLKMKNIIIFMLKENKDARDERDKTCYY
jgi:hypothetical protein